MNEFTREKQLATNRHARKRGHKRQDKEEMRQWWGEINERDADDGDTAKRSGAQPAYPSYLRLLIQRITYLGICGLLFVRLDLHIHAGPHTEANKAAVHTRLDHTQKQ